MDRPAAYLVRGGSTDDASLLSDPPLTDEGIQQANEAADYLAVQGIGQLIYLPELAEKQFASIVANAVPQQSATDELYCPIVYVCYPSRKSTVLSALVMPGGIAEWNGESDIRPVFKSTVVPS